ncbi:unnamed protein product [Parnassius mnemosyne]|uniref:Reverse transcriptase domain-containing protein n=1 Tax=Parnassius mnemosyne TaxID=213953 RepID=A0AAV1K5X6_9NEOP
MYADDLQIYTQSSLEDLSKSVDTINADLTCISNWSGMSKRYGLTINPKKTQAIIIGSSRLIRKIDWSSLPPILLDCTQIPYSNKVKNLGLYLDSCMSWTSQINEVSRKMFAALSSLRRLRNFLPTVTKVTLAQSLLLPILDYADICYLDITEEQLNKLERIQNLCIRFIFGLRKYDHISEFRKQLKWLPIRLRRNTHILSTLYSVLFNPSTPHYLKDRFQYLSLTHNRFLRSSVNLSLSTPSHSSSFFKKSFTVTAVRLWNSLPLHIRRAQSLHSFKCLVKSYYLERY